MRSLEQQVQMGLKPPIAFAEWPKLARWDREVIVTEKLDGTNAQVYVDDAGDRAYAGSRNKWISIEDDNAGFARWVADNHDLLLKLGPGHHYGEWWGAGIQRKYGLAQKHFSLFNVTRWADERPACCDVVPVLWRGMCTDMDPWKLLADLKAAGSAAAPGFMDPEGIVIFHVASGLCHKMTLDHNDRHKWEATQ